MAPDLPPFALQPDGTLTFEFPDTTGDEIDVRLVAGARAFVALRHPRHRPITARVNLDDEAERRSLTTPLNGGADAAAHELFQVWQAIERFRAAGLGAASSPASARPSRLTPRPITAAELVAMTFPEPRWAVPGIFAEGANLLTGPPKKGKSFLVLGAALGVAAGGHALGKIEVEAGDVLYLALEDGRRRLQDRVLTMLDGEPAPARLHFYTEWPKLDEGGAERMDGWLTDHPEARLVIVDVMARLQPEAKGGGSLYQAEYQTMAAYKGVADRHRVALVAVHHTRKLVADDWLDMVSGTHGLAGAADTVLMLRREAGKADAVLHLRGRDVPEADHALSFDPPTCLWGLLGDAAQYRLSTGRTEVVALLGERGAMSPKAVAEALGMARGNVRMLLHRMAQADQVVNVGGAYAVPPVAGVTGVTDAAVSDEGPVFPATGVTGATPPEGDEDDLFGAECCACGVSLPPGAGYLCDGCRLGGVEP